MKMIACLVPFRVWHSGLLERMAMRNPVLPEFLIVSPAYAAWQGYAAVAGVQCAIGGMHRKERFIYRNIHNRGGIHHARP